MTKKAKGLNTSYFNYILFKGGVVMKYIKNDINTSLLYLLMFTAIFITVITISFSLGFSTVYASSNANVVKINQLEQDLSEKQKTLENTKKDIEILKQRLKEQLRE